MRQKLVLTNHGLLEEWIKWEKYAYDHEGFCPEHYSNTGFVSSFLTRNQQIGFTTMRTTEADARIEIDSLLRKAGWAPNDKSQVLTECSLRFKENDDSLNFTRDSLDYPHVNETSGKADYVLLDQRGRPLAVIEAKKTGIDPYTARQQALPYAKSIGAPFLFLTNGELIYFWDYKLYDARIVDSFYSRRDLEKLVEMRTSLKPLASVEVPENYIRLGEARSVRPYQQEAMRSIDHALELGKRRFLIELPTGTGKTDLVCLYVKRLIQSGRAERVLFLVDREQLAHQALEALQDILTLYSSYWLKPGATRHEEQITVCLLQTMISRYEEYSSGYFDVIIADECHRSIYGAWQNALTHFDGVHLGLTATPASYIERNTFQFYQCTNDQPDFSYSIVQAFRDKFLVPYKFAEGITKIMAEGATVNGEEYDPIEFERTWTNEDTNRKMMHEFDRLAWDNCLELAPELGVKPGKTVVFAITKHHAARLAHYLNMLHPELRGNYAEVITSDVFNADQLIRKFKQEDYPQIAVSVGMLDTGFDCREVLHLVMCRRVRSPILYQQMRGRGTRTAPHIKKQKFVIYDFFGNHEYFNDSDTDVFTGYGNGHLVDRDGKEEKRTPRTLIELGLEDEWLHAVSYIEVGTEGERVDKKDYVTNWESAIKAASEANIVIQKIINGQALFDEEEKNLADMLNRPEMYYNEDNLRRAYKNPGGNLIDFIRAALGILKVRSKDEALTENFHAWLVTKNFTPEQAQYLTMLKNRGVVTGKIDLGDLFDPPLSVSNAAEHGMRLFGEDGLKGVLNEMNQNVFNEQA